MKRPILRFLLALSITANAATVCWGCFSGLCNGPIRYTCNQATGVSSSFRPDPIATCCVSVNPYNGCNSVTITNQQDNQTWNGAGGTACSGSIIGDSGWKTITPTPVHNDNAYTCVY